MYTSREITQNAMELAQEHHGGLIGAFIGVRQSLNYGVLGDLLVKREWEISEGCVALCAMCRQFLRCVADRLVVCQLRCFLSSRYS